MAAVIVVTDGVGSTAHRMLFGSSSNLVDSTPLHPWLLTHPDRLEERRFQVSLTRIRWQVYRWRFYLSLAFNLILWPILLVYLSRKDNAILGGILMLIPPTCQLLVMVLGGQQWLSTRWRPLSILHIFITALCMVTFVSWMRVMEPSISWIPPLATCFLTLLTVDFAVHFYIHLLDALWLFLLPMAMYGGIQAALMSQSVHAEDRRGVDSADVYFVLAGLMCALILAYYNMLYARVCFLMAQVPAGQRPDKIVIQTQDVAGGMVENEVQTIRDSIGDHGVESVSSDMRRVSVGSIQMMAVPQQHRRLGSEPVSMANLPTELVVSISKSASQGSDMAASSPGPARLIKSGSNNTGLQPRTAPTSPIMKKNLTDYFHRNAYSAYGQQLGVDSARARSLTHMRDVGTLVNIAQTPSVSGSIIMPNSASSESLNQGPPVPVSQGSGHSLPPAGTIQPHLEGSHNGVAVHNQPRRDSRSLELSRYLANQRGSIDFSTGLVHSAVSPPGPVTMSPASSHSSSGALGHQAKKMAALKEQQFVAKAPKKKLAVRIRNRVMEWWAWFRALAERLPKPPSLYHILFKPYPDAVKEEEYIQYSNFKVASSMMIPTLLGLGMPLALLYSTNAKPTNQVSNTFIWFFGWIVVTVIGHYGAKRISTWSAQNMVIASFIIRSLLLVYYHSVFAVKPMWRDQITLLWLCMAIVGLRFGTFFIVHQLSMLFYQVLAYTISNSAMEVSDWVSTFFVYVGSTLAMLSITSSVETNFRQFFEGRALLKHLTK